MESVRAPAARRRPARCADQINVLGRGRERPRAPDGRCEEDPARALPPSAATTAGDAVDLRPGILRWRRPGRAAEGQDRDARLRAARRGVDAIRAAKGWVASIRRSVRSSRARRRQALRPAETADRGSRTGSAFGEAVRPASERVTSRRGCRPDPRQGARFAGSAEDEDAQAAVFTGAETGGSRNPALARLVGIGEDGRAGLAPAAAAALDGRRNRLWRAPPPRAWLAAERGDRAWPSPITEAYPRFGPARSADLHSRDRRSVPLRHRGRDRPVRRRRRSRLSPAFRLQPRLRPARLAARRMRLLDAPRARLGPHLPGTPARRVTRQTMHALILRLESAGLLERRARNQRVVLLRPTKPGRDALRAATGRLRGVERAAFTGLSQNDETMVRAWLAGLAAATA